MSSRPRIAVPVPTSLDLAYNRQCLPLYLEAVERSGGDPVTVPLDGTATFIAAGCAGVLLPGSLADVTPSRYGQAPDPDCGMADPHREAADMALLDNAERHGKPVFGICYGLQMMNVRRGGSLLQHLAVFPVNHAAGASVVIAHTALLKGGSLLSSIVEQELDPASETPLRLAINSSHHQAIAAVGDGLQVAAACPQDGVIEAIEACGKESLTGYTLGVQWHPERSYEISSASRALFHRLIAEARG